MGDEFKYIEFNVEQDFARLTLNRPPLNVINIEMLKEINKVLKKALDMGEIKLLVIDAKGQAFSAGLDIKDHRPGKIESLITLFHRMFFILKDFKVPVMSVVNGTGAFGGGCELAVFCDIVIASENAKFVQPEMKVGVIPPIAAITYPRIIGTHATYEMLFTGKEYKAPQASRMGLISKAIADDKLDAEVNRVIKKITSNSLIITKLLKQSIEKARYMNFDDALKESEKTYTKSLMRTSDMREGLDAFLEKRKPVWKNK